MTKDLLKIGMAWQSIADSLGYDFEFKHNIHKMDVIAAAHQDDPLYISDDTQLAYFGIRAMRRLFDGEGAFKELIVEEYLNWYQTQTEFHNKKLDIPAVFYRQRCPGKACMTSMQQFKYGKRTPNQSRGCGSVMRLLPFNTGLLSGVDSRAYSQISGLVTHDHIDSVAAVSHYCVIARELRKHHAMPLKVMGSRSRHAQSIDQLGAGFYAEEAVDMAIWSVHRAGDYLQMLSNSIAHDGDSDSVGAIAGGLWGLYTKEMPPPELLARVVEWPHIEAEIDRMNAAYTKFDKRWLDKRIDALYNQGVG